MRTPVPMRRSAPFPARGKGLGVWGGPFSPHAYASDPANRARWLSELGQLLAFPTVSADPRQRPSLEAAATWLSRHLTQLGMQHAEVLPGPNGGAPSVYADWLLAPGRPTLLLYGHYDVQLVEPLVEWHTPPFRATRIGRDLVARGASDDKGQLFIHLKALESHLATSGRLPLNVKVWLEGEEEINSPNLDPFLDRQLDRLQADAVLVSDTEMPDRGRPAIIYGLRGNVVFELEVRGPSHDLHSGRYGGAVLNPAQALSELIAGLHDRQGRVRVPGFYARVCEVSPEEREALHRAVGPDVRMQFNQWMPSDAHIQMKAGVPAGWGEAGYTTAERTTIRPALTINGITSGYTGPGGRAIIPAQAMARLSVRLVPDQDPDEVTRLFQRHIAVATPAQVRSQLTVTGSAPPLLLPHRHPAVGAAVQAVQQVWGRRPVFQRSGGSIPLVGQLHRRLGAPIVLLGFGLPDDKIHAPNEKLDLPVFFRGVETVIQFLSGYGR